MEEKPAPVSETKNEKPPSELSHTQNVLQVGEINQAKVDTPPSPTLRKNLVLGYSAIGIIYGDIGTSPLYALDTIFNRWKAPGAPPLSPDDVIQSMSVVFWVFTLIVIVKYVGIVLYCDYWHAGLSPTESGILSGTCKPNTSTSILRKLWAQKALLVFVLLGISLILGDGVLTPAISILSAVEGLKRISPDLGAYVVPITCIILFLFFMVQRFGTKNVSSVFSPIILAWFLSNASIGIYNLATAVTPNGYSVWSALSPHHVFLSFEKNGSGILLILGGALLTVTGAEALSADLGHFNRASIQLGTVFVVYPCLLLTYLGQASKVLENPLLANKTFWMTVPSPMYYPMLILATLATIVASQALVTVLEQAVAMNFFPSLRIINTSKHHRGQVYIAEVNYCLMVLTILMVAGFRDSEHIAAAYGVAVASVFIITLVLVAWVMYSVWHFNIVIVSLFLTVFSFVDGCLLVAAMTKFKYGGFIPIVFGVFLVAIMVFWRWGKDLAENYKVHDEIGIEKALETIGATLPDMLSEEEKRKERLERLAKLFKSNTDSNVTVQSLFTVRRVSPVKQHSSGDLRERRIERMPGIGIFFTEQGSRIPPIFCHFVNCMPVMPKVMLFVTVTQSFQPFVQEDTRITLIPMAALGVYRCVISYGYKDEYDGAESMALSVINAVKKYEATAGNEAGKKWMEEAGDGVTFFLGHKLLVPKKGSGKLRRVALGIVDVLEAIARKPRFLESIPSGRFIGMDIHMEV